MTEVVYRGSKRLIEEGETLPQLIIIDGGKGQLSSSVKSLVKLGILDKVTIVGIAKKLEEIFFPGDSIPLYINKKSESLKLIQHCRNEAHRFAITFHRNLRSKSLIKTELTDIPGIGNKTAEKLLKSFGSIKNLRSKTLSEIAKEIGQSAAQKVWDYLNKQVG
jgi:excinuclease ABC subunit C